MLQLRLPLILSIACNGFIICLPFLNLFVIGNSFDSRSDCISVLYYVSLFLWLRLRFFSFPVALQFHHSVLSSVIAVKEETKVLIVATVAWGLRKCSRAIMLVLIFIIATKPGFIHAVYCKFYQTTWVGYWCNGPKLKYFEEDSYVVPGLVQGVN